MVRKPNLKPTDRGPVDMDELKTLAKAMLNTPENVARDYEAMIEYYRDRIGLRLLHRGVRTAFAVLGGTSGSRDLYLFRMREGWPVGLHHVGSLARDEADLAASASSLARAGLALERDIDHASRRCIHIKDPDGLRLQFYIDRGDPLGALDGLDVDTALFLA